MSAELQKTTSWTYQKGAVGPYSRALVAQSVDVAGSNGVLDAIVLSTAVVTLNLGALTGTLGWAWFHNADATQTIKLYTGAGGKKFATLLPGEEAFLRLGDDITAPQAVAVAGTPTLEYFVLPP